MRQFVVTLRTGQRYTVRADRVAFLDHHTLGLLRAPEGGGLSPTDHAVAVFDLNIVISVVAADHLVAEEDAPKVVIDPSAEIPF